MDWSFLDEMDKNLLYLYVRDLSSGKNQVHFMQLCTSEDTGNEQRNKLMEAEVKRKSAFYIIWFVFRYVLGCETLEKAEKYINDEIVQKYKLKSMFQARRIYIGVYGLNEIYLYKYTEGDLNIILEILYGRYDFFEQLECFIRRTEGTARSTRNRCKKAMEQVAEMMKDKPEYRTILHKYKERQ